MKIRLALILILAISYSGYTQTKVETIKTINALLTAAVGTQDSVLVKEKKSSFKVVKNMFLIDDDGSTGHFKSKLENKNESFESDNASIIKDWTGFKVHQTENVTTLRTIYPLFKKRNGELNNDKNGIRYYCLAGSEEKLIAALMHLQNLYSQK
ncbi:hypothetical protein [Pedobacter mucosus]|uniref:hypothetical protein n=1 Tax=Pedobacter mucosus TaxID=2895286 RepID=UPI001EE41B4D|nr:hypothetical protein [Pedobacter mucosus]UKT64577.1 hypothetical protein LOK61_02085 [Pedobacter mucosus]